MINNRYEVVIGLEVHCQLSTASKLFCGCSTSFGALPNHNTCPVCLGHPGVLPVANSLAVDYAVKFALAVGAEVKHFSEFARKQYFYPDLPKGYQISQYDKPYCLGGGISLSDGTYVELIRAHLEEDAGKNIHGDSESFVDLNRAGIPLLEIVTKPVIHSAKNASEYLKRLRALVRYLGISDGNMEEGSFRCDANISLRPIGQLELGTRCEIKNLNSFKNIERAINYEVVRQSDLLDAGQVVSQETMLFDPAIGKTRPMRGKEEAHDYRYFPDPDLKFIEIDQTRIRRIRETLPELPLQKSERFQKVYCLSEYDASLLTSERELAEFFEATLLEVGQDLEPKIVANWVVSEFLREANDREWDLSSPPVTSKQLGAMLKLLAKGTISGKIAKTVFRIMVDEGGEPEEIVTNKGLVQISDTSAIDGIIESVLADNQSQIEEYLSGKEKVFGFFVGQVMRLSNGKLNPGLVNSRLREKLDARKR